MSTAGRPRNDKANLELSRLWISGASIEKIATKGKLSGTHGAYSKIVKLRKVYGEELFPIRESGRKSKKN